MFLKEKGEEDLTMKFNSISTSKLFVLWRTKLNTLLFPNAVLQSISASVASTLYVFVCLNMNNKVS